MEDIILIAGTGVLHSQLIQTFLDKEQRVISTAYSENFPEPETDSKLKENSLHTVYPWTPSSSLSPRNILIQTRRDLGSIKTAYLVFPSGRTTESFHETTSAAVQKILDYRVKSYIFFLKELINFFIEQKQGTLNAVLYSEEGEWLSPLIAGTYEMFRAVIQSCFHAYEREPFCIRGFESRSPDLDTFREYILKHSREAGKADNRFYSFPRKSGLFTFSANQK